MSSSENIHEQLSLNIERRINMSNSSNSLNYCIERVENHNELNSSCIQFKSQSLRTSSTEIKKETNNISIISDQSIDSERLYNFARTSENLFLNSDSQQYENEDIFEGFLDLNIIKNSNNKNEDGLSKTLNHVDSTKEIDSDSLNTKINAKKSLYHQTKKDFYSRDSNFEVIVVNSIKNSNKANKVIKLDHIKTKIDSKWDTNNLENEDKKINPTKKMKLRNINKCTSKNTLSTQSNSDKTVNMCTNTHTHTHNKITNKSAKQSKIKERKNRLINPTQTIKHNFIAENNRNTASPYLPNTSNLKQNFPHNFPTNTSCFNNFNNLNNNNQANNIKETYNNKLYLSNNNYLNLNSTINNSNLNNLNPQHNNTHINNSNNILNYDWNVMSFNNNMVLNNINNNTNINNNIYNNNNNVTNNVNFNRQYNFPHPNNFVIVNQPQQYNNIPVSSLYYFPQTSSIYYQSFNNQVGYN